MKIRFRYKDQFTNGNWDYQQCDTGGVEECKRIYGLGVDTEAYEILEVDGKLTVEGKLEKIEEIGENKRCQKVWYDKSLLNPGREDSIWYGGEVLSFDVLDDKGYPRFRAKVLAEGEVRMSIGEETVVEKNNDPRRVIEFLEEHGITDDATVAKAEFEHGALNIGDRNWFEIEIYDRFDDKDIMGETDGWIIDNAFDIIRVRDEVIKYIDTRNQR